MWQFIVAAVLTVAKAVKKKDQNNENAALGSTAELNQATDIWEDNAANNKSIAATNLQNSIRTGFKAGMLNVQRAQSRKLAAAAGTQVGTDKLKALSTDGANAAAVGSIGASVDAVAADTEMKAARANESIVEDARVTDANYDNELTGVLQAGDDAIISPQHVSVRNPAKPRYVGLGEAIGAGLVQFGSQYLAQRMQLGLGQNQTAPQPGYIQQTQRGLY